MSMFLEPVGAMLLTEPLRNDHPNPRWIFHQRTARPKARNPLVLAAEWHRF